MAFGRILLIGVVGDVAATEQVGIRLIVGVLVLLLLKRRRDREKARVKAMPPAEREHHDAVLEFDTSLKSAEKANQLEVKSREARLKAARKASSTAAALGSRSIGSHKGKDGSVSVNVNVNVNELRITVQRQVFPLDAEVKATVDTAENLATSSRTTFTRVAAGGLLFGPVGAIVGGVAKKNKVHDMRELYLLIEGSEFAQIITGNIDDGPKVRQLAVAITQAGKNAANVAAYRDSQIAGAAVALAAEEANTGSLEAAEAALVAARTNTSRVDAATAQLALEAPVGQEPPTVDGVPPAAMG